MLKDNLDRKVHSFPLDLNAEEEVLLGPFVVIPEDGSVLGRSPLAEIDFFARETGSGDPFVNLSTPIDLSGYAPGVGVSFDFKAIASDSIVGRYRGTVSIGVIYQTEGAAWY